MSLNFNLADVPLETRTIVATEDHPHGEHKKGDRLMSPITHTLIFGTMATGIGDLSDDANLDEYAARLGLLQKLGLYGKITEWVGDDESGGWVERDITPEEIQAHKGMTTNVFPYESRAAFIKRWVATEPSLFPHPEPKKKR